MWSPSARPVRDKGWNQARNLAQAIYKTNDRFPEGGGQCQDWGEDPDMLCCGCRPNTRQKTGAWPDSQTSPKLWRPASGTPVWQPAAFYNSHTHTGLTWSALPFHTLGPGWAGEELDPKTEAFFPRGTRNTEEQKLNSVLILEVQTALRSVQHGAWALCSALPSESPILRPLDTEEEEAGRG